MHEDVHAHRYFGPPKGGCGRAVDLPPFLAALLKEDIRAVDWRELLFVNRHEEPIGHTDWLYCGHTDWLYWWHAACEGDGAAARVVRPVACCWGARFHDLRHTRTMMLTELGVPEALRDDRFAHHQPGVRALYTHTGGVASTRVG